MKRRLWTPEELDLVNRMDRDGHTIQRIARALAEAGCPRSEYSVQRARSRVRAAHRGGRRSQVGGGTAYPTTTAILYWPARPKRVTELLAVLAESSPTLEQYEREKARILEGSRV